MVKSAVKMLIGHVLSLLNDIPLSLRLILPSVCLTPYVGNWFADHNE